MKTINGDFGYLGQGLGADANLLDSGAKALVTAWQSKKITLKELKDAFSTGRYSRSTAPYGSAYVMGNPTHGEFAPYARVTRVSNSITQAFRAKSIEPIYRSGHTGYGGTTIYFSFTKSAKDSMEMAINYINDIQQESQERLALEKQITELKLSQELAQAEVTQARLQSQQLRDQLQEAILKAQLDKAKSEAKIAQTQAELETKEQKRKENIKKGAIATAVATGAYFLMQG